MNNLFKLRGRLDNKTSIILIIVGTLLLIGIWWGLAELNSDTNVKQIDFGTEKINIENEKYYYNDSLLIADLPELQGMNNEELSKFGLVKTTVHKVLPTPGRVIAAIGEMSKEDNLWANCLKSIKLNFLGYLMAIGISIPLGYLLGLLPLFRGLFSKQVDASRFIPLTAVTTIFILWLGFDDLMKVSFLAFGIIVYLVPVVVQRIDEVNDVYLKTVFTLGANSWQTIKSVYLPSVLSRIFDDIRVLTAISWTYITIVEMLNQAGGIGGLIYIARRQSRIDKAFAILLIIIIIGLIQDQIFAQLDRWFFPHKYVKKNKY